LISDQKMVLEAIIFCLDNSEWMRNGDYSPTRMQAQIETAAYIASVKVQHNPETAVGVLSMAGKRIDVRLTPTREVGDLLRAMDEIKIEGTSNFLAGLKTAQLALKNRQNKNQKQRIILFVGSPMFSETKEYVKLGKMLKKNSVAVDVIHFGHENLSNANDDKLHNLISAVNNQDNSHLVNVPPGPHQLSDMVQATAILQESGGGAAVAVPAAVPPFGGVDANLDPELAMALRESMEEEKARQQARVATTGTAASSGGAVAAPSAGAAPAAMEEDEDALLQQALALSLAKGDEEMSDAKPLASQLSSSATSGNATAPAAADSSASAGAGAASGASAGAGTRTGAGAGAAAPPADADLSEALQDPDFLENLLSGVGLSRSDVELADILHTMADKSNPSDKDKDKDKDKSNKDQGAGGSAAK